MSNKPVFNAFVVEKREGKDAFWIKVGAVFAHSKGGGMTLFIPKGISLSGEVILQLPKDKEAAATTEAKEEAAPPEADAYDPIPF